MNIMLSDYEIYLCTFKKWKNAWKMDLYTKLSTLSTEKGKVYHKKWG